MPRKSLIVLVAMIFCLTLSTSIPRNADAGMGSTLAALAAPLADQFGLPGSAVQSLFDQGISLESATQLLLISQSAKSSLDSVTKLFQDKGKDVTKTAQALKVDAADYSDDKVQLAIEKAKAEAAEQVEVVDDAAKAAEDAGKALGGFKR